MATIKFYAGLRKVTGTKETSLTASSLREVLEKLVATYPALQNQVWDGTALRPHVVITLNGHTLDADRGLDHPVGAEDQIAIFPPIAGG